ncbi:MAG: CinA family protein [Propionibacteriaceae bacterium]
MLAERGQTLATAESLTGGLLGAAITAVAGASAVYRGGLVVYATDLKVSLAGVDAARLDVWGAVSDWTAGELAAAAAARCRADFGLATTGVAGPDRQEGHPVGTVFIGVHGPVSGGGRSTTVRGLHLSGGRAEIRAETVRQVLAWLLTFLRVS